MSQLKSSKLMRVAQEGEVEVTRGGGAIEESAPKANLTSTRTYKFKTFVEFPIPDGKPTQEQVDALVKLVFIKAAQQVPKNLFPNLVEVSDPVANIVLKISYNGKEFIRPLPEKKFHFTVKDTQINRAKQGSVTVEVGDSVSPANNAVSTGILGSEPTTLRFAV